MKLIITILLSSVLLSCSATTIQSKIEKDTIQKEQLGIEQKAEQLKIIYQKLTSPYGEVYEQEYFNAFPDSFGLLNGLFGYTDKKPMGRDFNPRPLYNDAYLYIEKFFKLNEIEKEKYNKKIIDISINGIWYADGVANFQHGLQSKVKNNLGTFCELLSNRKDKEIKSFWYFYFDGPCPEKKIPEELQKVKQINKKIYLLMQEALKDVQEEWKGLH